MYCKGSAGLEKSSPVLLLAENLENLENNAKIA